MHLVQKELIELLPRPGVSPCVSTVVTALTVTLTLCRSRALFTGGRKARQQARKLLHNLPPRPISAFDRKGDATLLHVLELFTSVYLQAKCISDPTPRSTGHDSGSLSFVYQLGSDSLYVGQ
eukprot:8305964-Pyramimonas_sp.AAC.1